MQDVRLNKLAKLLVNYSTNVKPGDFVFVTCDEAAIPWMLEIVKEATIAGAHVETHISSEEVKEILLKYGSTEQLEKEHFLFKAMLEKADVWISAWGGKNTKINSKIPGEKLSAYSKGAKNWRAIYSSKMGDGSLRWCGTQFPTYSDAQEASMSLQDYEDFVYSAGLLNYEDPTSEWKKVSENQEKWVKYLDKKKKLHIISKGTDLTVNIEGRKWINCDGKLNFPDGEIFTSPVEDGVDGTITFSYPAIYMGKEVEGIVLKVQQGKVINATAEKGEELLHSLLNTDEGASIFGEVAIGTNYGIKEFTKNILFDEKIGGTIHLAIGDSIQEAGGMNKSSIHWDMICAMQEGGKIYADGELFYENGNFIESILK